nr:MAG TPA: hypothetical protein [Bacteriophage sp.]DAT80328.1 MAG TPA: hypothetical protein [Bacteriophage sp.]
MTDGCIIMEQSGVPHRTCPIIDVKNRRSPSQ